MSLIAQSKTQAYFRDMIPTTTRQSLRWEARRCFRQKADLRVAQCRIEPTTTATSAESLQERQWALRHLDSKCFGHRPPSHGRGTHRTSRSTLHNTSYSPRCVHIMKYCRTHAN